MTLPLLELLGVSVALPFGASVQAGLHFDRAREVGTADLGASNGSGCHFNGAVRRASGQMLGLNAGITAPAAHTANGAAQCS